MARKTQDELKALLLQRVQDIYTGATGDDWSQFDPDDYFLTMADAARVLPALRKVFGEMHPNWWVYRVHVLDKFEQPHTAAEFLWEQGVRPNKRLEPQEEQ